MPIVDVLNMDGEKVGEINLADSVFGIEVHEDAIYQAVVNQLANMRQGTHSTKTRAEVRGGGAKPWRQKGTGRARQGSIRAVQWVKGGIAFGPKPRSYRYAIPRKVKRLALKSALTSKVNSQNLIVLNEMDFDEIKTARMIKVLENLKIKGESTLIVLAGRNERVEKSARNIPGVKTMPVNTINVYDLLKYNKLILTKDAVAKVEEVYAV